MREEDAHGDVGAEERGEEDGGEGFEDPADFYERDHLGRCAAALGVVAGGEAGRGLGRGFWRGLGGVRLGVVWHDSLALSSASHGERLVKENDVGEWVRLCGVEEAPGVNEVREAEAPRKEGRAVPICLANVEGKLSAIGNICPHRLGPLGGGWIEEGKVMCPWHAWAFDVETGEADAPETGRVRVYPLKVEGADVLVEIEVAAEE